MRYVVASLFAEIVWATSAGCAKVLLESDPTEYHVVNDKNESAAYVGMIAHRVLFIVPRTDCVICSSPVANTDGCSGELLTCSRDAESVASRLCNFQQAWKDQPAVLIALNPIVVGILCDDGRKQYVDQHSLCRGMFLRETGVRLVAQQDLDRLICKIIEISETEAAAPSPRLVLEQNSIREIMAELASRRRLKRAVASIAAIDAREQAGEDYAAWHSRLDREVRQIIEVESNPRNLLELYYELNDRLAGIHHEDDLPTVDVGTVYFKATQEAVFHLGSMRSDDAADALVRLICDPSVSFDGESALNMHAAMYGCGPIAIAKLREAKSDGRCGDQADWLLQAAPLTNPFSCE